ncbi:MAG: hypothetical protein ACRDWY_12580, partial [Actinomycetes bacterium]
DGAYVLAWADPEPRLLHVGGTRSKAWIPVPCDPALSGSISAAHDGTVWLTCSTGTQARIFVGTGSEPFVEVPHGPLPNSVQVAARTARDAIVSVGPEQPLRRLTSNGELAPVAKPPVTGVQTDYVGFTSPDVGYALVGTELWRTDDGGDVWAPIRIR